MDSGEHEAYQGRMWNALSGPPLVNQNAVELRIKEATVDRSGACAGAAMEEYDGRRDNMLT